MRAHLGEGKEAVIGYWPNAAIGLVRNAGEQWLASPASPAKPDQETMARQITDWLCAASRRNSRTSNPDNRNLSEPTKEST